ncbi:1-acylglycerol-3-phosphate O-acyltransferase 6 (lysophosphatidic acid acyltransferase, zeta) [Phlyctochytrium bullatum]|nr:1-acylglycerol-3-phosphate O-acyltransferase 6 (lysophosphatidic acid acyltransferase, zeta) [Phlyctochytrium bullatum]
MRKHIHNPDNVPLLIFPEGTCVNNEYTVLFHKGAFEMDAAVVPVAIKYNKAWADAYWHSKTQTFTTHILYLMTRWALVADVWYLPPQKLRKGETSSDFANDVKAKISRQAKLKNLSWDGYFKNFAPAKDKQERLRENPQTRYGAVLMSKMRTGARSSRWDKFSYLKRSNSICLGDVSPEAREMDGVNQPDWHPSSKTTETRNTVLVKLLDEDGPNEMIQAITDQKSNILNVWKNYTKLLADVV